MVLDFDVRQLLADIACPALVLQTTGNLVTPPEHGRYLAEQLPEARYVELPGPDHFPFKPDDAERWNAEILRFILGESTAVDLNRVVSTVVFTDIVSSTAESAKVGDQRWNDLLDQHDVIVRDTVTRFGARLVKSTGDGILATLDSAARAVRCAQTIRDAVRDNGIEIRAGLHTGEIELRAEDIGGTAVNVARRVCDSAEANEVRVSESVVLVVAGSGLTFEDLGPHELKGVPGSWRLYKARD
jgi:class 3 adenylate cyclase